MTENSYTPPRAGRTAKQHALQAAILDEATRLFSERGFESTRIADVAKGASVAKGTVLYHFHSKEDLWMSVVDKAVADFELSRALDNAEPTLEAFLMAHRRFMQACTASPAYFRITALEMMLDTWRSRWIGERHLSRHVIYYQQRVEQLQQAGALPDLDPLVLQAICVGGYQLLVGQAVMIESAVGRDVTSPDFIERYLDVVAGLLSNANQMRAPAPV
ncbi:regulatory protein TetR [Sphingobium chlorophenolicum L-1]|uniref:Regulatory protein TetR n=1 Tax=Sphingobium chlorophenolicum L-1 TaxID=690566 RepID=F6F155_SPHCR|nr:TetR/AcrR family transcriptional regulator [Sphingobium chlorophenolicum]AEG51271.1 regulatory protein TetR [Sphingobium chlorophenolicum L-1]